MPRFILPARNGLVSVLPIPLNVGREADRVIKAIRRLTGTKIVTITLTDRTQSFDVYQSGRIGHLPGHDVLMRAMLASGIVDVGGVVVRQFLPERGFIIGAKGPLDVPRKRLYGIMLGRCRAHAQDAATVRECMNTDCETGAPIKNEELVEYATFPFEKNEHVDVLRHDKPGN